MAIYRSLIRRRITRELYRELSKIPKMRCDNNAKGWYLKKLLAQFGVPFTPLGSGTNRYGILIDGYACKFALDDAGRIDNLREYKYGGKLYPYCVKAYEVCPYGLIEVTEYVEVMSIDDFFTHKTEMLKILDEISPSFLIGDIGVVAKNHKNWGIRHTPNGDEVVMLDYAYIYDVSSKVFECTCHRGTVQYTDNYASFFCPACKQKFTFGQIHQKLTMSIQKKEIGDITQYGYVLNAAECEYDVNEQFLFGAPKKKQKKHAKIVARLEEEKAEIAYARACANGEEYSMPMFRKDD